MIWFCTGWTIAKRIHTYRDCGPGTRLWHLARRTHLGIGQTRPAKVARIVTGLGIIKMPRKERARLYRKRRKRNQFCGRKERRTKENKALEEQVKASIKSANKLEHSNSVLRRY